MAVKQLPTMSVIPEPPNRLVGDQERFDTMAFNSLKAQEKMVNEDLNKALIPKLNQFAVDVNASVDAAKASETSALASKNSAASSATTATTKAGEAAASATAAKASETSALNSKNAAGISATTAANAQKAAEAARDEAQDLANVGYASESHAGLAKVDGKTVLAGALGELSIKLTDSVTLTDSTTAASAAAVKTAHDAAQSKLPLAGGIMSGSIQVNIPSMSIEVKPSVDADHGVFIGDKNGTVMGGFDLIQGHIDNAKYAQIFSKNTQGDVSYLAAITYEDRTKEIVTDSALRISDIQLSTIKDFGNRVIIFSGNRGNEGLALRYSPDNGELYLDGRAVHGKADTAGHADTADAATFANGADIANRFKREDGVVTHWHADMYNGQPDWVWGTIDGINSAIWNPADFSVNYANSAGNAGTLGGKAESALSVSYAGNAGHANTAQNAYTLTGAQVISFNYPATQTLPGYGTWMAYFTTIAPGTIYNTFSDIMPGGTVLSLDRENSVARGLAIRIA